MYGFRRIPDVALRYTVDGTGLSDTHKLRLVLIVFLTKLVQELNRIFGYHAVEHILDFIGTRTLVCDDE